MLNARHERVATQLQQEIALIIHRELKDERLGFVTITTVDLSRDGSHAKVGFSCLGGAEERRWSQEALDHAAGFVRGQLARRLRLKIIPAIVFRFDENIKYAIDMEAKLNQLKDERRNFGDQ